MQQNALEKFNFFTCKWANAFQTGLSLIGCFNGDRYKFAVVTLTIEHFVGRYFASLFVDGEFRSLLIRLLNYRVFDLQINSIPGISNYVVLNK